MNEMGVVYSTHGRDEVAYKSLVGKSEGMRPLAVCRRL